MNPQQFISSLYKRSECLPSVNHLERFRKQDSIYVMGNGPSAFVIPEMMEARNKPFDVSGTSAAVFQERKLTFYWYEPHFLQNAEGFSLSCPESCSSYALARILHHEWTQHATSESSDVLIPSPQIPSNSHGYSEVPTHECILIPPWHFVNEINDIAILQGLKSYFKTDAKNRTILNFRGSVIRQLSTAFALGYKQIYLGGLDPSTKGYWYTDKTLRDKHVKASAMSRIQQVLASYEISLQKVEGAAPSESSLAGPENTYFDFERSIIFIVILLCKAYPGSQATMLISDKRVKEIYRELCMRGLKNLRAVNIDEVEAAIA
jgi:hypothetical protein